MVVALTICIPPRSEIDIIGNTQFSIEGGGVWLLEGKQTIKYPLMVARAVVKPYDDTNIVNPHRDAVALY